MTDYERLRAEWDAITPASYPHDVLIAAIFAAWDADRQALEAARAQALADRAFQSENGRLRSLLGRAREALEDAGRTMRNYYGGAISRSVVEAQLETVRTVLAELDAEGSLE